jgi:hypothetical protein
MEGSNNTTPLRDQEICSSCQSVLHGPFCATCGKPKTLRRIDGTYILEEIASVFNFNKGIFFTLREILLRPGLAVRDYLQNDRNRLVKPVVFVILCSLLYSLAQNWLRFEDSYADAGGFGDSAISGIFSWIQQNYGYTNIMLGVFIAFWIKIFFRKSPYNLFEILVLLCFIMGLGMVIYMIFGVVEAVFGWKLFFIGGLLAFFYTAWAIGDFFSKRGWRRFFKAFIAYLLGSISFYLVAIIFGILVDLLG